MSANLDYRADGTAAMYSVREAPWHREGIILGEYPGSWDEARKHAGLDWEPLTEPTYRLTGLDESGLPVFVQDEGWNRIYRSDRDKVTLTHAKDSYTLIDHKAMGEIVEAILEQPNVKYETAGCLDEGRAVWALVKLDEPLNLPGDPSTQTYPFIALTNRHDAQGGCTARATAIRIVCMNTFVGSELEGQRHGATFSFRHTKNWRDRIEDAKAAVTGARREMVAYVELANELLAIEVTPKQRELFVAEFIPMPPAGIITDRVVKNVEMSRSKLRALFASPTTFDVAHTAYGLVQAAGEYLDHVRTARTWETRLNRSLMRAEPLKRSALKLALAVAKSDAPKLEIPDYVPQD